MTVSQIDLSRTSVPELPGMDGEKWALTGQSTNIKNVGSRHPWFYAQEVQT